MIKPLASRTAEADMSDSFTCRDPSLHQVHFCKLKKKGLSAEVSARSQVPAYVCHNCGARADFEADLCNASPLPKS
jgi:transcription elongation factor Elf1